jgi:hypothetical protein
MWNVPANYLCDKHLLGEHVELHMFIGALANGKSLKGYIDKGLVEVHNIPHRHYVIVREMLIRGFNHVSLIDDSDAKLLKSCRMGRVDKEKSIKELCYRCKECNERIQRLRKCS